MSQFNTLTADQLTVLATSIQESIEQVTQAERITKVQLALLSRELLVYAYAGGDISLLNDLLGRDSEGKFRLTPLNWRIAVQYFNHFVAYTSNYDKEVKEYATKGTGKRVALVFNKKSKQKYNAKLPEVTEWLETESNNIWTYSDDAVMEVKAPDYVKNTFNALVKALDEEQGGLDLTVLLSLVLGTESCPFTAEELLESAQEAQPIDPATFVATEE